jgi:septum formation protein
MKNIILASSSPYRKALLERLAITFDCISPDVDEDRYKSEINDPIELAEVLGKVKAQVIAEKYPECIVIGSDQLGHLDGKILGKPHNHENAFKQLKNMQGKEHQLITSVSISYKNEISTFTNITRLKMKELSDEQINFYLRKDKPFDCAGSYKLELCGIGLFESIQTDDQTAIIGLPLLQTAQELNKLGVVIPPEA